MRNLVLALVIGMVMVGAASAHAGHFDPTPKKVSWFSVASLCLDGDVGAMATSHGGMFADPVYTSTYQVLQPIGTADGFEVNSKIDPVVAGEYIAGAVAVSAKEINQVTGADGKAKMEFEGIEGYASGANDVMIAVNGYDTAFAGIDSNVNAVTSVDGWCGNMANSGSSLDVFAIATGMPPVVPV